MIRRVESMGFQLVQAIRGQVKGEINEGHTEDSDRYSYGWCSCSGWVFITGIRCASHYLMCVVGANMTKEEILESMAF